MKAADKVYALVRHAVHSWKGLVHQNGALDLPAGVEPSVYPSEILDVIVFHKLHLSMPAENALRSYEQLRESFVDWNEARISTVREIQDALAPGYDSLELAVFLKDLLEFVHRERQNMSLEFLATETHGEIRRYLKQIRGIDASTVELILHLRKEHPVLPLNQALDTVLTRLGIGRRSESLQQKGKALHGLVAPGRALVLHHFLLNHSREVCPPDESHIDCPRCGIRRMCAFFARTRNKNSRQRVGRGSSPLSKRSESRSRRSARRKTGAGKRARKS